MSQGVEVVGPYVRDQDEALVFYGTVDAGFRDPSGNGWKMIQRPAEPRKH